jgi:hypothetical protein
MSLSRRNFLASTGSAVVGLVGGSCSGACAQALAPGSKSRVLASHSIFYYPYATLGVEQSPLLKVAALYFDKLFMLDPMKASWATIGAGGRESDLRLLESEGILDV